MTEKPWHENDEFWVDWGPRTVAKDEEVDAIIDLLSIPAGGAVLDLACGLGRHCVALAQRGYSVTGVDRTAALLDGARTAASEAGTEAEFVEADMREFRRDEAFDGAINIFTSFGYFEDRSDDQLVLENCFRNLKPGARLIVDVVGKETVARKFTPREWTERDDGTIEMWERWMTQDWSWMENRRIIIQTDGNRRVMRFSHRLYSAIELSDLMRSVGFDVIEVYGHLTTQAPYDENANRLVVTAKKPLR
jgi:SAM-dependent methyltransferase